MIPGNEEVTDWKLLIENARNGCDESLGKIADQVRRYLKTVAANGIAPGLQAKFSASDVVQISMIEALEGIANFRGSTQAEMQQWLKQIVIHNLTDEAKRYTRTRSRDVRREVPADKVALANGKATNETPSWHARLRETEGQMLQAIEALPPRQQFVVKARFRDGLDYPEIAQQLKVSEAATRQLWSRAAETLRGILGKPET